MNLRQPFILSVFLILVVLSTNCSSGKQGFSLARTGKSVDINQCFTLLKKKKHENAVKCFEAFRSANRASPLAAVADLAIADSYYQQKEYLSAAELYAAFTQANPYHEKIPYAYLRQGQSYYKSAPKSIDRDQSVLDDAEQALQTVIYYYKNTDYYPEASELYKKVKFRKAKREFYVGRFYHRQREYLAAIERFKIVADQYADSGLENDSFLYLVKGLKATGQTDLAKDYASAFAQFFPERTDQIERLNRALK